MKSAYIRRRYRRPAAKEPVASKKDNQSEQQFFGEIMHEPFFKPAEAIQQSVQRKCADCEKEDKIQRSPEKKEEEKVMKREEKKEEKVQRLPDKKEEEKKVQKKDDKKEEEKVMKKEEKKEEEKIHKKEGTTSTTNTTTSASNYIGSINNKGQNMNAGVRSFYENRIGADFSNVKIHTGKEAAESAKDINAQAYAYGNHIVFNEGKYQPETSEGKHLLAHELAHVVQQADNMVQRDDVKTPAVKPTKKEELIGKIKSGFGIAAVTDGDASFTWQELQLVYDAFAKIPAADITAINGAILKRVKNAGPTVMAVYNNHQQYDDTNLIDEQSITISDAAFSGTGTTPAESTRAIIHEIGHAVSKREAVKKTREAYKAGFEYNKAINKVLDKKKDLEALPADADEKTRTQMSDELTALRQDRDTKKTVSETKDADMNATYANVTDFKSSADSGKTACETEAAKVNGILTGTDTNSAAYRTAMNKVQASLLKFYNDFVVNNNSTVKLEADKTTISSEIKDRNQKRIALQKSDSKNTAIASLQTLSGMQDGFFSAAVFFAMNKLMANPVRRFYDFVIANGIAPTVAFSPYANLEWPNKPGEFYAEAYSYFITDPKKLETFSKLLFDWFKAGNYK